MPKEIKVTAIRGNSAGEAWEADVVFQLQGQVLSITEGGITGYEGFYIDNSSSHTLKKMGLGHLSLAKYHPAETMQKGWIACAGGGGWDRLFVPVASMQKVAAYFEIWGQA